MADAHPHALTPEQVAHYEHEGYLLVRGLLPLQTVEAVRSRFEKVVDEFARQWLAEGLIDDLCEHEDFAHRWSVLRSKAPAKTRNSWRTILVSEEIYRLWQEPTIVGAMRSLIGDELYASGIWNGRPRHAGDWDVQRVTWHQDAAYYQDWDPADGRLVTCWTPLVPVDEKSGCLQLVPTSHARGYVPFERKNGIRAVPERFLQGAERPFSAVMEPGDLLMFDPTMLHQALDNRSGYTRWSIDLRFGPATETIISKSPAGYYCFSASDPTRVESYETWSRRYEPERAEEAAAKAAEIEERARELGVSAMELRTF